jgi:hydrogenase maturation protein HypF
LFDAVASLCGVRTEVNYEGQAAAELEALLDPAEEGAYPLPLHDDGGAPLVLDARATVSAIVEDLRQGAEVATVAARFHNALAVATAEACARTAERHGTETVVLSGGAFQNRRLMERGRALVEAAGLQVLTPELLPPNDGGIAYGQLAVAAARAAEGDVRA